MAKARQRVCNHISQSPKLHDVSHGVGIMNRGIAPVLIYIDYHRAPSYYMI